MQLFNFGTKSILKILTNHLKTQLSHKLIDIDSSIEVFNW